MCVRRAEPESLIGMETAARGGGKRLTKPTSPRPVARDRGHEISLPPRLGYLSTPDITKLRKKNRCVTKKIANGTIMTMIEPASRIPGPFVPPCGRVNMK